MGAGWEVGFVELRDFIYILMERLCTVYVIPCVHLGEVLICQVFTHIREGALPSLLHSPGRSDRCV